MTSPDLAESLQARFAQLPSGAIAVAFSGGMDSTVLLHALANAAPARTRGLRAVHIDHQLHPDSAKWAEHCRVIAAALDVPFVGVRVEVPSTLHTGREDAARRARYASFAALLGAGETLALAHHREDQAETVLLKLLRGAGPEGLAGMRMLRPLANGHVWRPLLQTPRAVLANYASAHALHWIEDPSNVDTHLRRNFLRAEILPRLEQHWPDVHAALAHSAGWARDAAELIDAQAATALEQLRGEPAGTLDWRGWLALPEALRDPVLRRWLRALGLDEPAHFHVAQLQLQLRTAAPERVPCVRWDDTEVRRYRDLLYAMRPLHAPPPGWLLSWDGTALALPGGGSLSLAGVEGRAAPVFDPPLTVRFRQGGERLKPAGKPHSRELRLLLQEAGMPPWQRAHLPLIQAGAELIAAGDRFLSDAGRALCAQASARIVWTPP